MKLGFIRTSPILANQPLGTYLFLRPQYTGLFEENRITTLAEFLSRENGIIRSQNAKLFPLNKVAKLAACAFLAHSILKLIFVLFMFYNE